MNPTARVLSAHSAWCLLACLTVLPPAPARGQGCGWATKPPLVTGRQGLGAVAIGGRIYAVGGATSACGRSGTVEVFDPATNVWNTNGLGAMPTARAYFGAAGANGLIYVVGGETGCSTYSSALEVYDTAANTWSARPSMPGGARYHLGAALINDTLYVVGGTPGTGALDRLEAYDPATNAWQSKAPMPTPRYGLAVVALNGQLYALGGFCGGTSCRAVEVFDPVTNAWSTRAAMPLGLNFTSAGVVNGRIYVVGGSLAVGQITGTVVSYDPASDSWTIVCSMPTARIACGVAATNGALYAIGGDSGGPTFLRNVEAFPLATALITWTLRVSPTAPSPRVAAAMAFDPDRSRSVLFGGFLGGHLFDTWEWDGTDWTQRFPASSPPPRDAHAMAHDPLRRRVVLFGGWGAGSAVHGDTWEWDGSDWTQLHPPASPGARGRHALAYDPQRARVVLFGGWNGGGGFFNDTWEWDGTRWTQRLPGGALPMARQGHALAYDAARDRIVLFGGASQPQAASARNDTWEWDGTNWTQRTPITRPAPRLAHTLAFDALRRRVVLFGGVGTGNASLGDTWEWDGSDWIDRFPAVSPSSRDDQCMTYDAARSRTVLFGGAQNGAASNQTWEYQHVNPATYTSFGTGCPGSNGTPTLAAAPGLLPWLGDEFAVVLSNARPLSFAVLMQGVSNTFHGAVPLPLNLTWNGAPLCHLRVSLDLFTFAFSDLSGSATVKYLIPGGDLSLIGAHIHEQFAVYDTSANALGVSFSQGGDARFQAK